MTLKTFLAAVTVGLTVGTTASAVTVNNGSFEDPGTFTGGFQTIVAGSGGLVGWTVERGSVDLIDQTWVASDQRYSLDLDGNSPSTISQTITGLELGKDYKLTFDLASNGTGTKSLDASIGQISGTFTFDGTGTTQANMGWLGQSLIFTAEATSLELSFASNSPSGPFGPALDNIAIAPVPLPAGLPLLLLGLGGIIGLKRRKKTA